MFSLTSSLSFYMYMSPIDMRNSFDGLSGIVQTKLQRDPLSGEVFIFYNKRRNKIKLLHWEYGGFTLYYKRLECGTLEMPKKQENVVSVNITWSKLVMIIEGISLKSIQKRKRYLHKKT